MTSYDAYYIAVDTGVSSLKLEKVISKNGYHSYYAIKVLKGRFELGEGVMSKNGPYSYEYALYVLKGPFELGEGAISQDWFYSWRYATVILKRRFKLGEKAIIKYSTRWLEYSISFLGYNHE